MRSRLRRQGIDGVLISSRPNVTYLTGFSGDSSYLVLTKSTEILVSDGRFTDQLAEECPGLRAHIRQTTGEKMSVAVAKVCRSARISSLAFEEASMSVAEFHDHKQAAPKLSWVGTSGWTEALRARKDSGEVRQIREAIRAAESAFVSLRGEVRSCHSEKWAADRLESLLRGQGAERGAFDTIVASGPHAAQGHARPDDRTLDSDRPIVVDWGAAGRFYKSDLTRVLAIRRIPAKLEAIYKVVLKAQCRAVEKIRPGVLGSEVDAEARRTIESAGFGRFFNHSTGHGIGLEVHEGPALRPGSETILKPGMVVTVEPGIYIRGWGGVRIEDDVLVTRTGHEVLSSLPKGLDSVLVKAE